MAPHSPSTSMHMTQESISNVEAAPVRALRLSLEPRPAATSLSASPSLDSLTPTHSSQHLCGDSADTAASTERHASPFFAGWERHPELDAQDPDIASSATGAERSSATQYHAELQSLHTRLAHHAHHQPPSASPLLCAHPPTHTSLVGSLYTPLSPLSASATMPSTPVLPNAPTPVFTPPPYQTEHHVAEAARNRSLPLPGMPASPPSSLPSILPNAQRLEASLQEYPRAAQMYSSMPHAATRSDSSHSISSTLNDAGHEEVATPSPPLSALAMSPTQLELEEPVYSQATVRSRQSSATHKRGPLPLPPQDAREEAEEARMSLHKASDPPLIPSLRRPEILQLAQELHLPQRPISPFSPTLATHIDPIAAGLPSIRASRASTSAGRASGASRDLIDFESEDEGDYAPAYLARQGKLQPRGRFDELDLLGSDEDDASIGSSTSAEEDDDDNDNHPLYATLSSSTSPYVRKAWEASRLVLVPPRFALPAQYTAADRSSTGFNVVTSLGDPLEWERFTAMHALRQQAGSPDVFVGSGRTSDGRCLRARVDQERGEVELSVISDDEWDGESGRRLRHSSSAAALPAAAGLAATSQGMDRRSVSLGMSGAGQTLKRSDTLDTNASTTSTGLSHGHGSALPPHLFVSSSPTSSAESSNFPITPPISPPLQPTIAVRSASGSVHMHTQSSERKDLGISFPTLEPIQPSMSHLPLSPSRRLKIVGETPVYRRRKAAPVLPQAATSAPSALPSPPGLEDHAERVTRLGALNTASSGSLNGAAGSQGAKTVKKKDSKLRLRGVPKWLGGSGVKRDAPPVSHSQPVPPAGRNVESAPPTPSATQSMSQARPTAASTASTYGRQLAIPEEAQAQLVIEKVRIIRVDGYIIEWPGYTQPPVVASLTMSVRHSMAGSPTRHSHVSRRSTQNLYTSKSRQSISGAGLATPSSSAMADSTSTGAVSDTPSRQNSTVSSKISRRSSNALRYKHGNASAVSQLATKDFSSDIVCLMEPPRHLASLAGTFEQALRTMIRLARDFCETFQLVRGYERYTVQRLRTEILDVVWTPLRDAPELGAAQSERLQETFENVIMAFLHDALYERSIKPALSREDTTFEQFVSTYRSANPSLDDFGIPALTGLAFTAAVEAMTELSAGDCVKQELWDKMSPQTYKKLVQTISETTDSASTVIALLEARTPLDCASLLRRVIDELVGAADQHAQQQRGTDESLHDGRGLAPDDLIPLLAWTIVKAGASDLPSLLYYTSCFRLSEHARGDIDWAIVQFEAAIAFLQTDPLDLMDSAPPNRSLSSAALSPSQPTYQRSHSHDSLQMRSRRASIQSLPADTLRPLSRSPVMGLHAGARHQRTISSLPGTRIVTYQPTSGRPSSIISTITSEEEDNAAMGPPAAPKRDGRTSTDDGHSSGHGHSGRPDMSLLSHSRHRSSSSYSLASTELQIRPQILRPQPMRPPTRSFHISQDLDSSTGQPLTSGEVASQPTRIPLERSQTTPYAHSSVVRGATNAANRTSADLARSGSHGGNGRRGSVDWWAPLRYSTAARVPGPAPASPVPASDHTSSPRPDSPASPALGRHMERSASERSSFDLERSSSDIGWLEWGRKRLSSMTSATSLVEAADGPKTVAELVAERIANSQSVSNGQSAAPIITRRPRRASESAANVLGSPPRVQESDDAGISSDGGVSEFGVQTSSAAGHTASGAGVRTLTYTGSRPKSTLSLSSVSSVDTDSSGGQLYPVGNFGHALSLSSSPSMPRSATHATFRNSVSGASASQNSSVARSRRFRNEVRAAKVAPSLALPQLHLDTASMSGSSSAATSPYLPSPGSADGGRDQRTMARSPGYLQSYQSSNMPLAHAAHFRLGSTPFSPIEEGSSSGLSAGTPSPDVARDINKQRNVRTTSTGFGFADNDNTPSSSLPPTPMQATFNQTPWRDTLPSSATLTQLV